MAKTIYAVSSGAGRAGVAVVRVSGPAAGDVLATMTGSIPEPRVATLRTIADPLTGRAIDHGIVIWFPGPASFTGEDVAEFQIHGGPAVVAALTAGLARLEAGADGPPVPAEAGEFTRRAFHNGKLDLTAVEGLGDLIAAETEAQRRQALRQMSGELGALYDGWRTRLVRELAYFEAQIDFPDEGDVPADLIDGAIGRLGALRGEIARHLDDGRRGERLRDGVRVAIAGAPNVGKSSLLNALARRDAAIVSERPGTTRDVIEVHLDLGGIPVVVADTAGLRASGDDIEAEGVRRAQRRIEEADIVVWVVEPGGLGEAAAGLAEKRRFDSEPLLVINKGDLLTEQARGAAALEADVVVSALTGAGMESFVAMLVRRTEALAGPGEQAGVTRARHRAALEACEVAIGRAVAGNREQPELIAEELRAAAFALGQLTGRVGVEELLEVIFADFCIGK